MKSKRVSLRISDKSVCIDIDKLEHETSRFLYIGFIIGILLIISLDPFYANNIQTYATKVEIVKPMRGDIITISLITQEPTIVEKETKEVEPVITDNKETVESPVPEIVDTLAQQIPVVTSESILRKARPLRKFPDLARINEKSLLSTGKPPDNNRFFPQSLPVREKKTNPPEEDIKDERKKFKGDVFGIPMGGGLALIPLARHGAKSIVWKYQDLKKKRKIEEIRNNKFLEITNKELRFLILLWRDGLIDADKLSKQDRTFITQSRHNEIQTNNSFLQVMEKRGLVSSLMVSGRIYYRANFSRNEILHSLISALSGHSKTAEKDIVFEYVELIAVCYDGDEKKVIIPKSLYNFHN